MGILGYLAGTIVGGVFIGKKIKRNIDARKQAEAEAIAEEERLIAEEERRVNTPCDFSDGFSKSEFEMIVKRVSKDFRRITKVSVNGPIVEGKYRSNSGITEWNFTIDYNDFGQITGRYWLDNENPDSNIPEVFAQRIIERLSEYVNSDEDESLNDEDDSDEEMEEKPTDREPADNARGFSSKTNITTDRFKNQDPWNVNDDSDSFKFPIDFPFEAYKKICIDTARSFPQIINVEVIGPRVTCTLKPRVGRNWTFYFELENNGKSHWDKQYERSDIPERYIFLLLKNIETFREEYSKNWMESDCPNCGGKMIKKSEHEKWVCYSCSFEAPADAFDEDSDYYLWFCDKCGTFLNAQSGFSFNKRFWKCSHCGHVNPLFDFDDNTEDRVNYCWNCGTQISERNAKFCGKCGKKLK